MVDYQVPLSMGFSRQEYWSGLPYPLPGDLPNPGIKPRFPTLQAVSLLTEPPGCIHSYNLPAAVQTEEFAEDPFGGGNTSLSLDEQIAAFERRLLEDALNRHGGSHSAAARELGLSPRMMSYRLSRSHSRAWLPAVSAVLSFTTTLISRLTLL